MFYRIKCHLLDYISRSIFGKDASVYWAWSDISPVGFFIAKDMKTMLSCTGNVHEQLKIQMKRKPAKILPFVRKGSETDD